MSSAKPTNYFITLLFSTFLILTGCDSALESGKSGMGTLEVRLIDAPLENVAEVNVVIDSVQVNNTDNEEGWETISTPMELFNLLELTNGAYAVLGEAELEAGTYEQIRLILNSEGNNLVFEDSTTQDLIIPSGTQTGIKLNINAEIEEGFTYTLILDFDAGRSVVKAGSSGKYLLKPVIRATNEATSGNISGTVLPAEAKSQVHAIADSDTLTSTFADTTDGTFKIMGLEEGSYTVAFEPRNETYAGKDTTGVEVAVGETNDLGTIELEQN